MRRPLLTFTRDWNGSKKRPRRRYPPDTKNTNASPASLSATATASTDPLSGSSYWTTAQSLDSLKAMVRGVPLTSSTSTPSPQYEASQSRLSQHGSRSASSDQCRNTKSCTKWPATLTTGALQLTLPDSVTSTHWSKRQQQRYISGRRTWLHTVNLTALARTGWRERGCRITSRTSRTWDPFRNVDSLHDAVGFPPRHVDVLM